MIDLGVQVRQAVPSPAPNPTVPLTDYHITDIHKNRSSNLSHRPKRPLRLVHKSSPLSLPRNTSTSILTFMPSYFDFVRMRSHLHSTPISVVAISEETPVPSVAHPLSHFFTGRHSVLLYSGQGYHIRRYNICGVTRVVFYALPDNSRITLFSTARSPVSLLGGALARGGLQSSRRCV